jgi:hypothetical protein
VIVEFNQCNLLHVDNVHLYSNDAGLLDQRQFTHHFRRVVTIDVFEVVSISAGTRGLQILLAPAEYVRATGARLGPIAALQ